MALTVKFGKKGIISFGNVRLKKVPKEMEFGEGVRAFSKKFFAVEKSLWAKDLSHLVAHLEDKYLDVDQASVEELKNEIALVSKQYNLGITLETLAIIDKNQGTLFKGREKENIIPVLVIYDFKETIREGASVLVNGEDQTDYKLKMKKGVAQIYALEGRASVRVSKKKPMIIHANVQVACNAIGMGIAYVPTRPDVLDIKTDKRGKITIDLKIKKRPLNTDDEMKIELEEASKTLLEMKHKLENALEEYKRKATRSKEAAKEKGQSYQNVIENFQLILNDLRTSALEDIENKRSDFLHSTHEKMVPIILAGYETDDEKMRSLSQDMLHMYEDLIRIKIGESNDLLEDIEEVQNEYNGEKVMLICKTIEHYEVPSLKNNKVAGAIEEDGSVMSHAAIAAHGANIPFAFRIKEIAKKIRNGDRIIVDGEKGQVIINPDEKTRNKYKKILKEREEFIEDIKNKYEKKEAKTKDGHKIGIFINGRNSNDIYDGKNNGAGLIRTEDFYSTTKKGKYTVKREKMPSREEQVEYYKNIFRNFKGKKVVIRTFDVVGGDQDKRIPYLASIEEKGEKHNGINLCIRPIDKADIFHRPYHELFKEQLKSIHIAALEAEKLNVNVVIEFPYVLDSKVFKAAMREVEEARKEMKEDKENFSTKIQFGCMIEADSVIHDREDIVKIADFFGLGTNDLTASVLMKNRYSSTTGRDELHKDVLEAISKFIKDAEENNKETVVCGEVASDFIALPILIALGVKNISVENNQVDFVKAFISNITKKRALQLLDQIVGVETVPQRRLYIADFIEDQMREGYPWNGLTEIDRELMPIIRKAQGKTYYPEKKS